MILETPRFRRAYDRLTADDQARVRKALLLLGEKPRHPSLRVKRLQGTPDLWSGRASDELRFTFRRSGSDVVLRAVGRHDQTLRSP